MTVESRIRYESEGNTKLEKMTGESRINALPDGILEYILSFLEMKQVVETSLISSRWRYLWLNVQTLNFDFLLWRKLKIPSEKFGNFFENVLQLRSDSFANKFSLSCIFVEMKVINSWLAMVLQKRVSQVSLEICYVGHDKVLTHLISSSSVEVLQIACPSIKIRQSGHAVQLPKSICSAPHLKTLILYSVRFPKGDFNGERRISGGPPEGEVTFNCPVLEKLILKNCYLGHLLGLNISTPQLKSLTVNYNGSCKIRICTPNLTELECYYSKQFVIEKCDTLVSAKIVFASTLAGGDVTKPSLDFLKTVTTLELFVFRHELRLKLQQWLDQTPNILCNLRTLKLMNWCQPSCIPTLASLLERSHTIEFLVLKLIQGNSNATPSAEDLEKLFSFQYKLDQLKSVKILNFTGCQLEIKLIESLLKNAIALKELRIVINSSIYTERLMRWCRRTITNIPTASSQLSRFVIPP